MAPKAGGDEVGDGGGGSRYARRGKEKSSSEASLLCGGKRQGFEGRCRCRCRPQVQEQERESGVCRATVEYRNCPRRWLQSCALLLLPWDRRPLAMACIVYNYEFLPKVGMVKQHASSGLETLRGQVL